MILTVTAVPTLDRYAVTDTHVAAGVRVDVSSTRTVPGGVGIALSHLLFLSGASTVALFPAPDISFLARTVSLAGLPHKRIDTPGPVQIRFRVKDASGEITEFVDPAMPLSAAELALLRDAAVAEAEHADVVVLAGPVPDVAPATWYTEVVRALALYHPQVPTIVAGQGAAMRACLRQLAATRPTAVVCCPADITGGRVTSFDGDNEAEIVAAARAVNRQGVREVIVYDGVGTAVTVNDDSAAIARHPGVVSDPSGDRWARLLTGLVATPTPAHLTSAGAYSTGDGGSCSSVSGRWTDNISRALAFAATACDRGSGDIPHPSVVDCTPVTITPIVEPVL